MPSLLNEIQLSSTQPVPTEGASAASKPVAVKVRGSYTRLRKRVAGGCARVHPVLLILMGVVVGIIWGLSLSMTGAHPLWITWLGMPGTLYLRALRLLVGPLVFCSVIIGFSALSQLGVSSTGVGPKCALLYLGTSVVGSLEGLAVTYMLMPAWGDQPSNRVTVRVAIRRLTPVDTPSFSYCARRHNRRCSPRTLLSIPDRW